MSSFACGCKKWKGACVLNELCSDKWRLISTSALISSLRTETRGLLYDQQMWKQNTERNRSDKACFCLFLWFQFPEAGEKKHMILVSVNPPISACYKSGGQRAAGHVIYRGADEDHVWLRIFNPFLGTRSLTIFVSSRWWAPHSANLWKWR